MDAGAWPNALRLSLEQVVIQARERQDSTTNNKQDCINRGVSGFSRDRTGCVSAATVKYIVRIASRKSLTFQQSLISTLPN